MAYPKKYKLLGKYLKEARQKQGLSQADVSHYLGYTGPQFISNWERGLSPVPISTLKQLIAYYQIDSRKLIEILLKEEKLFLFQSLE